MKVASMRRKSEYDYTTETKSFENASDTSKSVRDSSESAGVEPPPKFTGKNMLRICSARVRTFRAKAWTETLILFVYTNNKQINGLP